MWPACNVGCRLLARNVASIVDCSYLSVMDLARTRIPSPPLRRSCVMGCTSLIEVDVRGAELLYSWSLTIFGGVLIGANAVEFLSRIHGVLFD